MLGKLIKYEFKANYKIFLLMYIGLIFVTVVNVIISKSVDKINIAFFDVYKVLGYVFYVVFIIAISVVTLVMIIQRFYKTVVKDEGYLYLTLPVKIQDIINSKIIVGVFWSTIYSILVVLSVFTLLFNESGLVNNIETIKMEIVKNGFPISAGTMVFWIILAVLSFFIGAAASYLKFFASMALGQSFPKSKFMAAVLTFIAFCIVEEIFSSTTRAFLGWPRNMAWIENINGYDMINGILIFAFVVNAIYFVAYYLVTYWFLDKKLNLQ